MYGVYRPIAIHSTPVIANLCIHLYQVSEAGTVHWEELCDQQNMRLMN